jgi:hypothetical protein
MKYIKSPNIWEMNSAAIRRLQPGQWVYAGDEATRGQFLGVVKPSGTVVVAWYENAKNSKDYRRYVWTLRHYARGEG